METRDDSLWKEQLGFVSGTVLVRGALLLKLWPTISHMQTGEHSGFRWGFHPTSVTAASHRVLTILPALGFGMLLLGAAHILARGFWLSRNPVATSPGTWTFAQKVAWRSFAVLQAYWILCGVGLLGGLAFLPGVALVTMLHSRVGWSVAAAQISVTLLTCAIVMALAMFALRRRRKTSDVSAVRSEALNRLINFFAVVTVFFVVWPVTMRLSYVADLKTNLQVVSRSKAEPVIATVALGGATADPRDARVYLLAPGQQPRRLPLLPLSNGSYVTVVDVSTLPPSPYEIHLAYPHWSLSLAAPFVARNIIRREGFVVIH